MCASPRRLLPALVALAAPLFASVSSAPEETPAARSPWDLVALGLLDEARTAFDALPAGDRAARFGRAVTLLNIQPKTDANLDRAAGLFSSVADERGDDDLGVSSRYYLARIPQLHRVKPDDRAALALYRELAALRSPHPLAQRALVHIALIELFEPRLPADELRTRFADLASRGETLSDPSALRDFHLVMGDAALRFGLGDDTVLEHLLAADRAGLVRATSRRENWIRIAETARIAGRPGIAAAYYRRFLDDSPRDARRLAVKERLASLPQ